MINNYYKLFAFLFSFQFFSLFVFSQTVKEVGSPIIQNYTDNEYGTDSPQNWAIVQDLRGMMYIGNTEGVLEYDGNKWRLIKIANNSSVLSLAIDKKGTIYVGAVDEFGYLAPNMSGKLLYHSLNTQLNDPERHCGNICDICVTGNSIFFIGRNNIYKFHETATSVIKTDFPCLRGFSVNNELLIWQRETGIYRLSDNTLEKIPLTDKFKTNYKECVILPFCDSKILLVSRENGFCIFDYNKTKESTNLIPNQVIFPFPTEADKYLKENQLTTGYRLSNDRFVFGTLSGGIIIIDRNGSLLQIINKNRGLIGNGIYSLFQDKNSNLWAGLITGISKIEINSPLSIFNASNGVDGIFLSVTSFKNRIYIGTTNGAYYFPEYKMQTTNDRYILKHIKNTENSCWDFIVINNKLISMGPLGMVEINDTTATKINEIGSIISYVKSKKFPNQLFAGLRNGLFSIGFSEHGNKNIFEKPYKFEDINMAIWRPVEDKNGDIWFSDKYNGLYQIQFTDSNNFKKYNVLHYDTTDGLPKMDFNYPFLINNEIYTGTQNGVYKTHQNIGKKPYKFLPDNIIGKDFNEKKTDVKQLAVDSKEKIWIKSDKAGISYLFNDNKSNLTLYDQAFKSIGYVFKFFITESFVWMCSNHGVYKYDSLIEKNYNIPYQTIIRKVTSGKDSVLFWGAGKIEPNQQSEIAYKDNSLSFEFAAPFFEREEKIEFSYFLEGYKKIWSKWTKESKKEYTNLHEGNYVFHIKARNINGIESAETSFRFIIQSPWYRTYIAYFLYLFFLILSFYLILRLYSKRLKEQNKKLERLISDRTFEVEQQKEELQTQTENLALSNKELEKLSVVAQETDNAILIMDAQGNFEWINESLKNIYGFNTFEQFINAKGKNLLDNSANPKIKEILEECLQTKKGVIYESLNYKSDGKQIWAQTTISPIIDVNGKITKLVAIDSNITKIKEAEEEIKQQNEEIKAQRELLAKTNTELKRTNKLITDSIKYSKRIQEAILPSEKYFHKHFPDSFVFYKPRDIVSGDFYWISHHGSKEYFAVVDCTGHGVPGALMSMIGNTLLNEIVNEKRIAEPSKILELLSLRVVAALEKGRETDDIQSDGMDITLCCFDTETNELNIASANSVALFISKEGTKKIIGDFYSIGDIFSHNHNVTFTNYKFNIQNGDSLYLYSDGYQDQFGGIDSEKFMAQQFENLISNMQDLSIEKQLSKLSSTFEEWKGCNKQTDDVIVMGIRFNV